MSYEPIIRKDFLTSGSIPFGGTSDNASFFNYDSMVFSLASFPVSIKDDIGVYDLTGETLPLWMYNVELTNNDPYSYGDGRIYLSLFEGHVGGINPDIALPIYFRMGRDLFQPGCLTGYDFNYGIFYAYSDPDGYYPYMIGENEARLIITGDNIFLGVAGMYGDPDHIKFNTNKSIFCGDDLVRLPNEDDGTGNLQAGGAFATSIFPSKLTKYYPAQSNPPNDVPSGASSGIDMTTTNFTPVLIPIPSSWYIGDDCTLHSNHNFVKDHMCHRYFALGKSEKCQSFDPNSLMGITDEKTCNLARGLPYYSLQGDCGDVIKSSMTNLLGETFTEQIGTVYSVSRNYIATCVRGSDGKFGFFSNKTCPPYPEPSNNPQSNDNNSSSITILIIFLSSFFLFIVAGCIMWYIIVKNNSDEKNISNEIIKSAGEEHSSE
jgi:hypothetical protein